MRHKTIWMAALLLAAGLATAAWASFDSPDGEPPFGVLFESGRSGQGYEGVVTMIFSDFETDLTAESFEAVARLRKGGELHVFYEKYDCLTTDPCGICTGGRLDLTNIQGIQLCLQDQIEAEVISDFELGAVDVRLKDMTDFSSESDPGDPSIRVVAADIDVTVK
jgi:hypothetical protein